MYAYLNYMDKKYLSLEEVNNLGEEYCQLVRQGFGKTTKTRTKRQVEIAQTIVGNFIPFLYKLADDLVYGKGKIMPNKGEQRTLSLSYERARIDHPLTAVSAGAGKSKVKEMSLDDLVNEGVVRIVETLHNYHPEKGAVSTFIAYNAVAAMYRTASQKLGLVRIPVYKLIEVRRALRNGRINSTLLSINEMYRALATAGREKSPSRAALICLSITGNYLSLTGSAPSYFTGNHTASKGSLESQIKDPDATDPTEKIYQQQLAQEVQKVLATLTPKEQLVLERRFWLGADEGKTLEEIGSEMSLITREKIRQIEAKALRKLRSPSLAKALEPYL